MAEYCKCCNLPKSKVCNKCGIEKTTDLFYAGKKICKDCRKIYNQEQYIEKNRQEHNRIKKALDKHNQKMAERKYYGGEDGYKI